MIVPVEQARLRVFWKQLFVICPEVGLQVWCFHEEALVLVGTPFVSGSGLHDYIFVASPIFVV